MAAVREMGAAAGPPAGQESRPDERPAPPRRPPAGGGFRRLGLALAGILIVVEAGLACAARWSARDAAWAFSLAAVLTVGAVGAAFLVLGRRERRRQGRLRAYARRYAEAVRWDEQLEALHAASLEIARETAYPAVLQTIVDLAAGLARARYGALAVFEPGGEVEEFVTHGVTAEERERIGHPPTHSGLLGQLSGSGPVRTDDVRRSPHFTGMPEGHPEFRTFLGVAVRWEGELLGHLYLGGHLGERPFSPDEERLLRMFASEAGLAIARHRLYAAYAHAVRSAERRRLAMGLHDRTLQGLYALALQLGRARRQGMVQLTGSMTVEAALAAVERSMASIRQMLDTLQWDAAAGESEDLVQTVEEAAAACAVDVEWQGEGLVEELAPAARVELGLCLSEAVTNAARHGGARRVRIAMARVGSADGGAPQVELDVVDDGEGADAMAVFPGHGLAHIQERVRALGGHTAFSAREADGGAGVHIRVPLDAAEGTKGGDGVGSAHPDR